MRCTYSNSSKCNEIIVTLMKHIMVVLVVKTMVERYS